MASIARRAAGLVMIRADGEKWGDTVYQDNIYSLIEQGVGGVGVFLGDISGTSTMIADLQRKAGKRLLIGADYEHGLAMRLSDAVAFPRAMALGRTSAELTQKVANCIALEARTIGVHWNWAPVADIDSEPRNPVINIRSFGSDHRTVSAHAIAYIQGTQLAGVLACAKHVPGHGNTTVDSHVTLPTMDPSSDLARAREFLPFRACIEAGVHTLMMGHIIVPFLDAELPASLSKACITELVRGEWGFQGLVTTDALDMGAITGNWSSDNAAVMAVQAGADVVLMPEDPRLAIDALTRAIETGAISEETLAQAESRWEAARAFAGVKTWTSQAVNHATDKPVDQSSHALLALQVADEALSIDGNIKLLPLTQYKQVAAFAVINENDANLATTWFQSVARAVEINVDFGFIDGTIEETDQTELQDGIKDAEVVLFAFFSRGMATNSGIPGRENLPAVLDKLSAGRPTIFVVCGSPHGYDGLNSDLTIYTYSDTLPSMAASVMRLAGRTVAEI